MTVPDGDPDAEVALGPAHGVAGHHVGGAGLTTRPGYSDNGLTASFHDRQEEDAWPLRSGLRQFGGQPFCGDFRPHKDDPLPLAEVIPAEVGWRAAGDNDGLHLVTATVAVS